MCIDWMRTSPMQSHTLRQAMAIMVTAINGTTRHFLAVEMNSEIRKNIYKSKLKENIKCRSIRFRYLMRLLSKKCEKSKSNVLF